MANVWQITEREADLLLYLPHAAQILYLTVFRRHMCFTTGTVGNSYRLSEQALAERLEVNRPRGSTTPDYKPTRQAIRTAIAQLIRAGLLIKLKGRQFTFKLPVAATKPKRAPVRAHEEQPNEPPNHPQQSRNSQTSQPIDKSDTAPVSNGLTTELPTKTNPNEQPDEQPTTGLSLNITKGGEVAFSMFENWRPQKRFDELLKNAGLFYTPGVLMDFKLFWMTPNQRGRALSQSEWEYKLFQQIQYKRGQSYPLRNNNGKTAKLRAKQPASAPYSAGHKPFNQEKGQSTQNAKQANEAAISALDHIKRTVFGQRRQTCYKTYKRD